MKDQQERISHEMRLARQFDGPHVWNTASAVARLYQPESRWTLFLRWLMV
jgi:hypothetical protein